MDIQKKFFSEIKQSKFLNLFETRTQNFIFPIENRNDNLLILLKNDFFVLFFPMKPVNKMFERKLFNEKI
jgi:hypothetical protein